MAPVPPPPRRRNAHLAAGDAAPAEANPANRCRLDGQQFTVAGRTTRHRSLTVTDEGRLARRSATRRERARDDVLQARRRSRPRARFRQLVQGPGERAAGHEVPCAARAAADGPSRSFAWAGSGRVRRTRDHGPARRRRSCAWREANSSPSWRSGGRAGAALRRGVLRPRKRAGSASELLPVHLTAAATRLRTGSTPWPVPFRYALTRPAAAAGVRRPGRSPARRSRSATTARSPATYAGQGWAPESLLGPGRTTGEPAPARGRLADREPRLRGR